MKKVSFNLRKNKSITFQKISKVFFKKFIKNITKNLINRREIKLNLKIEIEKI